MNREEIVKGLKAGRTLCMDGAATPEERAIIAALDDEGLIDMEFLEGEQYGVFRIRWRAV